MRKKRLFKFIFMANKWSSYGFMKKSWRSRIVLNQSLCKIKGDLVAHFLALKTTVVKSYQIHARFGSSFDSQLVAPQVFTYDHCQCHQNCSMWAISPFARKKWSSKIWVWFLIPISNQPRSFIIYIKNKHTFSFSFSNLPNSFMMCCGIQPMVETILCVVWL